MQPGQQARPLLGEEREAVRASGFSFKKVKKNELFGEHNSGKPEGGVGLNEEALSAKEPAVYYNSKEVAPINLGYRAERGGRQAIVVMGLTRKRPPLPKKKNESWARIKAQL